MLAAEHQDGPRDWCFSEAQWRKPQAQDKIDKILDVSRRRLGVASYVFANAAATPLLQGHVPERLTEGRTTPVRLNTLVGRPTRTAQQNARAARPGAQASPKGQTASASAFDYLICGPKGLKKASVWRVQALSARKDKEQRDDIILRGTQVLVEPPKRPGESREKSKPRPPRQPLKKQR